MSEKRIAAYTANLCERMNFGESIRRAVARDLDTHEPDPIVQDSFDGYLLYLVSGPIPSVKPIPFYKVSDPAAARRLFEADLRIRARNNSGLSGKLQRAVGSSRFGPILHDNAAVTIHTCIRFPEESSKALTATSEWLKESFATDFSDNPVMISVGVGFSETLTAMAEHRNLEVLLKVGWTEESAGVVYGGIQLHDNPQLLPGIFQLMVHIMTQVMAHPQAATGIAHMPHWLDSNSWWFPPNPILLLAFDDDNMDRKPQSIMQRAFDLGGSQQFSLTLETDESGLLLQMSLGEALANHMLARLIDIEYEPESSGD